MSEKSLYKIDGISFEEKFQKYFNDNVLSGSYIEARGMFNSVWLCDSFKAGYELAQKEMQSKINELLSNSSLEENKLSNLQQNLDTYIQLAETKSTELKEAREVIKKCMENTQESDTDNICREYLEKWK